MSMHPEDAEACDQIDAEFFSGDAFQSWGGLEQIEYYLARWNREAARIREQLNRDEADEQ